MSAHVRLQAFAGPHVPTTRPRSAVALRAASALLQRLARRLEARAYASQRAMAVGRWPEAAASSVTEFHAQAGAPEGALYVDGRLVGMLPVTRL